MPESKDAAECRRMAEHYLACAKQMSDPEDRAALMSMAQFWTEQAEEAQRNEGKNE